MFSGWWIIVAVGGSAGIAAAVAWRTLKRFGGTVQAERAKELFLLQRERLEAQFCPAARATGKPRGLRWVHCSFDGDIVFARELGTRQLVALAPITIQFEAVAGSDMEGLPAVGSLRSASAVYYFQRGQWHTAGKAVFNMNPAEALDHFRGRYEPIETN